MSIVSFKYRYIFVKTTKVAGTSVEALLRKYTGEEDIIPAVTPRDEHYSAKLGLYSRNYSTSKNDEKAYTDLVLSGKYEDAMHFRKDCMSVNYGSHMGIKKIEKIIKVKGLDLSDFYKFSIDRNPFSWLISRASYKNNEYNENGRVQPVPEAIWTERLRSMLNNEKLPSKINWNFYSDDGQLLVDDVLSYENLYDDLSRAFDRIGIEFDSTLLPQLKKSSSEENRISNIFNPDMFAKVEEVFASAIEHFGTSWLDV